MNGLTIAVLRGGTSSEYAVSMQSGAGVLAALADEPVRVIDVIISKQGEWLVDGFARRPEYILKGVDVAFLALHGTYGEDGTVQRLLERNHIPYTGSGPLASALAMNKVLAKDHLKDLGIKLPKHMRVHRSASGDLVQVTQNISSLFGPEYFVKPVNGGSSIDTQAVSNPSQLASVLQDLLKRHDSVLVEERIRGREATVGVIENFRNERHYLLPVVEIVPPVDRDFFDHEVKYNGATEEICPGRFAEAERHELQTAARAVHQALNLRHYSRSDFIVSGKDVYFLEVNTLPGLTSESLFPKAVSAVGSNYRELVRHLVHLASNSK